MSLLTYFDPTQLSHSCNLLLKLPPFDACGCAGVRRAVWHGLHGIDGVALVVQRRTVDALNGIPNELQDDAPVVLNDLPAGWESPGRTKWAEYSHGFS